jgi:hypothetical protein
MVDLLLVLRWVLSVALLAFGSVFIALNAVLLWRFSILHERGSFAAVVGGLCACLGILVVPVPAMQWWWWLPLIVDVGCLPLIVAAMIGMVIGSIKD